jgi:Kef-type K+ transport system membrane component KefB
MAAGSSTLTRILFTILLLLAVAVVSFFIGYLIGPPLLDRVLS